MFTLSKLTSLALGFLTLGSVGGIVSQAVSGTINPILEKDISKSDVDLSELITTETQISQQLTNSKNKYSSVLNWLNKLKGIKFHKILEAFTKLFKAEGELESKYKEAQEKFKELEKVIEDKGKETIKKLQFEKAKESLTLAEKSLVSLTKGLKSWQEGFQKVICALKNENGEGSGCTTTPSRAKRSAPATGGGTSEGTGSQKAKEALKEVQESLEKTNREIEEANIMAKALQETVSKMKNYQATLSASVDLLLSAFSAKEIALQQEMKSISLNIQQLFGQIKTLTKEIKSINQVIELLKKNISTVKNYEGKFLNSICDLYTVEDPSCKLK